MLEKLKKTPQLTLFMEVSIIAIKMCSYLTHSPALLVYLSKEMSS